MNEVNPVMQLGASPSVLTQDEVDELRALAARQKEAFIAKDYGVSDELRAELQAWGAWPPEKGWHPVSETPEHRQTRLARRTV